MDDAKRTTGEEARLKCSEIDSGRGIECLVEFAGKRFPSRSISMFSARAKPIKRELDEYRLRQSVWASFWRYIGAA